MTSEQYVQQIERLMDLQNTYLQTFLGILAIVVGIFGVVQWRFTSKQLSEIKEKTKQEAKKETIEEIEKSLGVSNIIELKDDFNKSITDLNQNIEELKKKNDNFEYKRLHYELTEIFNENDIHLWKIDRIMDIYKECLLKSINNFNHFINRVDNYILTLNDQRQEKVIDFDSPQLYNIIKKMNDFENELNEESEKLKDFKTSIEFHRGKKWSSF